MKISAISFKCVKMIKISGTSYLYSFICERKLWLYAHGILMESDCENVKIGKVIDENAYGKNIKHILIDENANVDVLKDKIIYEVKKSSSEKEAALEQIYYYLYILKKKGINDLNGELRIPKENRIESVYLTDKKCIEIEEQMNYIIQIISQDLPPKTKTKFCKKCAYFEFCFV